MTDLFNPLSDPFEHPVRTIFKSMPSTRPVVADLVQWPAQEDGTPEFWSIRLYRDDFDAKSVEDRLVISNWVSDVIQAIRTVSDCYLEVWERAPR